MVLEKAKKQQVYLKKPRESVAFPLYSVNIIFVAEVLADADVDSDKLLYIPSHVIFTKKESVKVRDSVNIIKAIRMAFIEGF